MAKKRKQVAKKQRQSGTTTPELVTWALQGLQQAIDAARARLEDLEGQARKLRGATRAAAVAAAETFANQTSPTAGTAGAASAKARRAVKKRKLSADARRRIAEAQKRRWAKVRATKSSS